MKHTLLFAALFASGVALAGPGDAVRTLIPTATIEKVEQGPLRGWSTVVFDGGQVAHVFDRSRHVVFGNVVRVEDGHSYTLALLGERRSAAVGLLPADKRVTFKAESQRAEIIALTDASCGFSMQFVQSIPALQAQGVTVHIYPAPRQGRASLAFPLMRDQWCSTDPAKAIAAHAADAATLPSPAAPGCAFDLSQVQRAGVALGMRGTPGVFTTSGEDLGGAAPVEVILQRLGLDPLPGVAVATARGGVARGAQPPAGACQ